MMTASLLLTNKEHSWTLLPNFIKTLHDYLLDMSGTMDTWDTLPEWGYRGIKLEMDPLETMLVFEGIVEVVSTKEVRRFMDVNREMEFWLFKTSMGGIPDEVFKQVLAREFSRRN